MIRERYVRQYAYDEGDVNSGFVLMNDRYSGDSKCPPFVPEAMTQEQAKMIVERGEVDYFDIIITSLETYIEERHKISRACRNVQLTSSGEKDGHGHKIMVGEIEEVR